MANQTGYSPVKQASQKEGWRAPETASRKPSRERNASESDPIHSFICARPISAAMSCSRVAVSIP